MKTEWLVTDGTVVRSPDKAERAILGVILTERFFDQFRPIFVVGDPLLLCRNRLLSPNNFLESFDEDRVICYQCDS